MKPRPDHAKVEDFWFQKVIRGLPPELLDEFGQLESSELEEVLSVALGEGTKEAGAHLLGVLKRRLPEMLHEHEELRIGFEERLYSHWGSGLNSLYMLIVMSRESGEDYNEALRASAVDRKDYVFEVLIRLHAKGCRIALEAWHLLRLGFASGAHARWRSLHEIAVTSIFLRANDTETAERYLHHQAIESLKDIQEYEKYYKRLGYEPPGNDELQALRQRRDELLARYGQEYRHTHGWAADALGMRKPTFIDIEAAANLDHYRPLYGLSNHWIHSGSKGLSFDLGLEPGSQILLVGASDGGLAEPGHAIAISLMQASAALLSWSPRVKDLIVLHAMIRLMDEIGEDFHRAHLAFKARVGASNQAPAD